MQLLWPATWSALGGPFISFCPTIRCRKCSCRGSISGDVGSSIWAGIWWSDSSDLASFPGLPHFRSSVCVQYNTRKRKSTKNIFHTLPLPCIILNANRRTKMGRPGYEASSGYSKLAIKWVTNLNRMAESTLTQVSLASSQQKWKYSMLTVPLG